MENRSEQQDEKSSQENEAVSKRSASSSPYLWKRQMTAAEVIKQLNINGWREVSQRGSHRKFTKNGETFPVPDHGNTSLAAGTLANIKRIVERIDALTR